MQLPRAVAPASDTAHSSRDAWGRRLLAVADVQALVLSFAFARTVTRHGGVIGPAPLLIALAMWILLHKLLGLYDREGKVIHNSALDEFPKILQAVAMGTLIVWLLAPVAVPGQLPRDATAAFVLFACLLLPLTRTAARLRVRSRFGPERCAIVGSGPVAEVMGRKLAQHPEYGVDFVGYIDGIDDDDPDPDPAILGDVGDLQEICERHRIARVVIAFAAISNERLLELMRVAKRAQLKITIVPRLYEAIGHSVELDEVEGMTVMSLRGLTRPRSSLALKRLMDVTLSAVGLLLLAPLLALLAVAIKLDSPGPVLYRQLRRGRSDTFEILKFRSMVQNADEIKRSLRHLNECEEPMFKIADDPRVTTVGKLLRRLSLDELPQLWNVFIGEMSLVGPRPLVPDEDDRVIGYHRDRLELTPGLTGPWQVAGRNAVPFNEMVKMDYLYVAEWSLWTDVRLLVRTAPVVLLGRGY